ncbi:Beta-galactosidase, partial [termite gut metagenome]
MKKVIQLIPVLPVIFFIISCKGEPVEPVSEQLWNDNWRFFRADSIIEAHEQQLIEGYFPEGADLVSLPHTSRVEPLTVNDQWQGICYYAKTFTLEKSSGNKLSFIRFDAAMNETDVWVNGTHLCRHLGGYLPFTVDLTGKVHCDGRENTLLVRLDNRDNKITGPKPLVILDFNTYGGIYRNVWFIEKEPVYITNAVAANKPASGGVSIKTSGISSTSANVFMQAHVVNTTSGIQNTEVFFTITDPQGKIVSKTKAEKTIQGKSDAEITATVTLKSPKLWSPDSPSLYRLSVKLLADGKPVDKVNERFGIRDVKMDADGLYLNGKKTFLRGVNRHQEYPYVGYALSDEANRRDAYKIKEAGFDYVRTSHYPPSPAFLDVCDELGIMALDAILGWQYFGEDAFRRHAYQTARDMIRRDRNHPCILAWELSINETWMPAEFMEEMNRIKEQEAPESYAAGWQKSGYEVYIEARQHRHGIDKSKPLLVSEYGDWEYYAQNAGFNQNNWNNLLLEERNSRQPRGAGEIRLLQQAINIQEAHNDNLSTHAFADSYWVMFDYNRGYADDLEFSGIMDIFRLPKFSYYFFRSQQERVPELFIASYWQPGISNGVRVYGKCEEVELYVNGKLIERRKPDENTLSNNLPHPPFTFSVACTAPGKLEAIGYTKGKEVSRYAVSTPGQPASIRLRADIRGTEPKV